LLNAGKFTMLSLLMLGFLMGMRHALDADHLAAVAAITSDNTAFRDSIKHGAVWGLGHTVTLLLFGSSILWLDTVMPEQIAHYLEMAVGVMLMGLGVDVLRRLIKDRIHYHAHKHDNKASHFHAHSHVGEGEHDKSHHQHQHGSKFPYKTLCIGFMHGMAGSAALILLTLGSIHSFGLGMLYMLLFGVGSIIGMAVISVVIAIPLKASSSKLTWVHNSLQGSIGVFTVGLGISIVHKML